MQISLTRTPNASDGLSPDAPSTGRATRMLAAIGAPVITGLAYIGGVSRLVGQTAAWTVRTLLGRKYRFGRPALYAQIVRLGGRSVSVVALVSGCRIPPDEL